MEEADVGVEDISHKQMNTNCQADGAGTAVKDGAAIVINGNDSADYISILI